MPSVFFPNIPENERVWKQAVSNGELDVRDLGPYVELSFSDGITIDRASTGARHAVWYSCIGALDNAEIVQFDKNALRIVAARG